MVSAIQPRDHYRPDIDGLRAVAVMAVVLHHLSPSTVPGGFIGVDVFFVISGYLITRIINREIQEVTFTFARFYERRIRRLFPALFAVLAFVLVAGWFILLPSDYLATSRAAAGTVLFSANIVFWRDLAEGYFAADAKLNPLLHMWSLGIEEQFYLLFPVFLLLVYRYARQWLVPALMAAFALSLLLSVALTPIKSVASYFLLPTRAWELLAGSLLAVLSVPQLQSRIWREVLAAASLVAITAPAMLYSAQTPFPGYAALLPVAGAVALIWLGGGPVTLTGRLLQLKPAVYIGLISYSLYLWHWPLIVFARFLNGLDSIRQYIPFLLLLSLVVAAISHSLIEQPFRKRGPVAGGGGTRRLYPVMATLAVALIALSGQAVMSNGFPGRYPADVVLVDSVRRAEVPWKQCEARIGKNLDGLCVLGDSSVEPDLLLWGDSHMLAWAPGFDAALKTLGRSAYFAPNSACPPILDVDQSTDPLCRSQNDDIMVAITDAKRGSGKVSTAVLAGFWQKYFNDSNLRLSADGQAGGNFEIAAPKLTDTLERLAKVGVDTIVMGAVPAYPIDVPYVVSSGRQNDTQLKYADMLTTNEYKVLSTHSRFADVASWFCADECRVRDEDGVFYRDSNHLAVHGAHTFQDHLARMLSDASHAGGQH